MDTLRLKTVDKQFEWQQPPEKWSVKSGHTLIITAGQQTDLISDVLTGHRINNSPRLTLDTSANFLFQAKVTVEFGSTFDAGALIAYVDESRWAKLCFEYSPQHQPMVVSVVTRQLSDDCNSTIIEGDSVYLRIARLDQAWAFHYSVDGKLWHLVRLFTLGQLSDVAVGFTAQSPTGDRCTAAFSEVVYEERLLEDIRSGA